MPILFWSIIIIMTLIALAIAILPLMKKQKPSYRIAIVLTLGLPLLSLMLYLHWGSSRKLEQYWLLQKQSALVKAEMAKIKSPLQAIKQLQAHLEAHPNSPKGWYLLGQIYLKMQYYQKALLAFKQAYQLKPNNATYLTGYAKAIYLNNKQLSTKIVALLENIVDQDAHNIIAINLLAINAYKQKYYLQAIRYWERLIPLFEPRSRDGRALLTMIARAQKQLKNNNQATTKYVGVNVKARNSR